MTDMGSALDGFGRFGRPAQQVIGVLSTGPRNPASIARDVDLRCGVDLGPGTLFGTLARLECHGLIEVVQRDATPRTYRLTALGAEALAAQVAAIRRISPSSNPATNGSVAR